MTIPQEIKIISQIGNESFQHPIWQTEIAGDCSYWILLLFILEYIKDDKIKLTDLISIEENLKFEKINQINLSLKKQYSLLELLQYLSFTQDSQIQQLLSCFVFGGLEQAQVEMINKAKQFSLNVDCDQKNTIQKLYHLAHTIFTQSIELLNQIFIKKINIEGKSISPVSSLLSCRQLNAVLHLSHRQQHYYFSFCDENKTIGVFHLFDHLHRIDHLVPYYHYFNSGLLPAKQIQAKSDWINIIGDTYFGEFYTKLRKGKGIDDALQRYGYGHSFEKIKQFFHEDDINIANFEAVFNLDENSPLQGQKAFILGAEPKPTIAEFKRVHINTLCLANNHLKDYGEASLNYSLDQLEQAKIDWIGAGIDQQQAHQYFEIQAQQQKIAIFNGYWHRDIAYQDHDFYALGNSAGVACLNAILFEQMMQYRIQHPQHKMIVICHWGVDFKPTHPEQKKIADILTQIGADLVIGHGAHTIQPIKMINHKPVIFGIGNGVFNSNGEFEKYQALAYGLVVKINVAENKLKLYPIFTHNLKTFWQPYPVDEMQFEQAKKYLTHYLASNEFFSCNDDLGHYIEMNF